MFCTNEQICENGLDTQYNKRDFNEAEKAFSYTDQTETWKQNEYNNPFLLFVIQLATLNLLAQLGM